MRSGRGGRSREYKSNADRQRAYRLRVRYEALRAAYPGQDFPRILEELRRLRSKA